MLIFLEKISQYSWKNKNEFVYLTNPGTKATLGGAQEMLTENT